MLLLHRPVRPKEESYWAAHEDHRSHEFRRTGVTRCDDHIVGHHLGFSCFLRRQLRLIAFVVEMDVCFRLLVNPLNHYVDHGAAVDYWLHVRYHDHGQHYHREQRRAAERSLGHQAA